MDRANFRDVVLGDVDHRSLRSLKCRLNYIYLNEAEMLKGAFEAAPVRSGAGAAPNRPVPVRRAWEPRYDHQRQHHHQAICEVDPAVWTAMGRS